MPSLAVINASQLLTLAGPARPRVRHEMRELGIVENAGLIAEDGQIVFVGKTEDVEDQVKVDSEVIDAEGRIVTPGFVDAHTHLVFMGKRLDDFERGIAGLSYQDVAAAGGGIQETVRQTRAATEEELYSQAQKHAQWFLANGTTTVEAKSGYGLDLESELKILRVIRRISKETPLRCVPTVLAAHAVPPEFGGDADGYLSEVLEKIMPAAAQEGLAEYCDCFCERGYFTREQCREVLHRGLALGLMLRIHADQLTNMGAASLAAELGAATADHLEQIDDYGMSALLAVGVQPVLLPGSVYGLGSQSYPPAKEMIDLGLAVVLASDFNPGSSPTCSMPMVHSLACTQMGMLPSEAIAASTINAAYSIGRGAQIGSLEPGKAADFVIWDCEDYREIAYWFGRNMVWKVGVSGEVIS